MKDVCCSFVFALLVLSLVIVFILVVLNPMLDLIFGKGG